MSGPAKAAVLTVYGGPTYIKVTGNGYKNPYIRSLGSSAGSGFGVGNADKYVDFLWKLDRPVRWDSSGTITEFANLGTNSTGESSVSAFSMNDTGTTVGYSSKYIAGTDMGTRAVRWDPSGTVTELGSLGTSSNGTTHSTAYAINNAGTAVGAANTVIADVYKGERAVRWDASGTAATELGNLGTDSSGFTNSIARAINDGGTSVGIALKYAGDTSTGLRAVRWGPSVTAVTELDNLGTSSSGSTDSTALSINGTGTAVGYALKYIAGADMGRRAVRWNASGTTVTELGTLGTTGTGAARAEAWRINDAGTAVGYSTKYIAGNDKGERAVRWDASGTIVTELGNLGVNGNGSTMSHAYSINESGVAVGSASNLGSDVDERAVMWRLDGLAIDLNTMINPTSGWILRGAFDISDDNWVTGIGNFDPDGPGGVAAYSRLFLIQVPEPTTLAVLSIAVLTLLSRRRVNQ